jgi:secondary thiamine-phosphate synthase enzyme
MIQEVTLSAKPRGVHLVERELLAGVSLPEGANGVLHALLLHTSAGLCLTENASPDVRRDLDTWLRHIVPDGWPAFKHTLEGADDMPAHVVSILAGVTLMLPVEAGRVKLGTWQGVTLVEPRDHAPARTVRLTFLRAAG